MNRYRIPTYETKINKYKIELKKTNKLHNTISIIRLSVFITALLSWFYIFTINTTVGSSMGVLMIVVFLILVKIQKKLNDKRIFLKTIIELNNNEIKCCNGNYNNFDNGIEFANSNHPYSYDMDIFGNGSLFQYINRTVTDDGKKQLSEWLSNTPLPNKTILQNQQAVAELSDLIDFRQQFYTVGKMYTSTKDDKNLISQWIEQSSLFKYKNITSVFLWVLPSINILLLILIIMGFSFGSTLITISLINLTLTGFKINKFNKKYLILSKSHENLKKATQLFGLIEKLEIKSPLLTKLRNNFNKDNISAGEQINKLTKLLNALDNRNNIILGITLNALLLWDWNYMWRIEKWKNSHKLDYENWQQSLSYFDALISLANLKFNNPDFTFPTLEVEDFTYNAVEIGHPLLHKEIRVCNNFNIDEKQRYAIVTGANMAGKSTFLRTIALNLILAGCGAPVCAKKMQITPLPLYSSMRAEDSLMKNESYFFAELKRLQRITKELDKNNKMFIILDEILRGTNSEDKRKGSIGFIKKITQKQAYGLVATHDLELAKLANNKTSVFKALCFEVEIINNKLQFDYKLTNGITQNMNASFLMKSMNIIDE
jgi:DNA mismatch repair ATPase MutS